MKKADNLAVRFPELVKEWNGGITPDQVIAHSEQEVNWICNIDHRWSSKIGSRTRRGKDSCPVCSNRIIQKGVNDVTSLYPFVLKEIYDIENQDLDLYTLGSYSAKG